VFDQDHGQAQLVVQAGQRRGELLHPLPVQVGRWLVQHQDPRAQRQHGRDGHALLLAAREGAHRPPAQALDAGGGQRLADARLNLVAG